MESELLAGFTLAVAAGGGAWLRAHEQRLAATESAIAVNTVVVQKLDKFMDLMIEEKLKQRGEPDEPAEVPVQR